MQDLSEQRHEGIVKAAGCGISGRNISTLETF